MQVHGVHGAVISVSYKLKLWYVEYVRNHSKMLDVLFKILVLLDSRNWKKKIETDFIFREFGYAFWIGARNRRRCARAIVMFQCPYRTWCTTQHRHDVTSLIHWQSQGSTVLRHENEMNMYLRLSMYCAATTVRVPSTVMDANYYYCYIVCVCVCSTVQAETN